MWRNVALTCHYVAEPSPKIYNCLWKSIMPICFWFLYIHVYYLIFCRNSEAKSLQRVKTNSLKISKPQSPIKLQKSGQQPNLRLSRFKKNHVNRKTTHANKINLLSNFRKFAKAFVKAIPLAKGQKIKKRQSGTEKYLKFANADISLISGTTYQVTLKNVVWENGNLVAISGPANSNRIQPVSKVTPTASLFSDEMLSRTIKEQIIQDLAEASMEDRLKIIIAKEIYPAVTVKLKESIMKSKLSNVDAKSFIAKVLRHVDLEIVAQVQVVTSTKAEAEKLKIAQKIAKSNVNSLTESYIEKLSNNRNEDGQEIEIERKVRPEVPPLNKAVGKLIQQESLTKVGQDLIIDQVVKIVESSKLKPASQIAVAKEIARIVTMQVEQTSARMNLPEDIEDTLAKESARHVSNKVMETIWKKLGNEKHSTSLERKLAKVIAQERANEVAASYVQQAARKFSKSQPENLRSNINAVKMTIQSPIPKMLKTEIARDVVQAIEDEHFQSSAKFEVEKIISNELAKQIDLLAQRRQMPILLQKETVKEVAPVICEKVIFKLIKKVGKLDDMDKSQSQQILMQVASDVAPSSVREVLIELEEETQEEKTAFEKEEQVVIAVQDISLHPEVKKAVAKSVITAIDSKAVIPEVAQAIEKIVAKSVSSEIVKVAKNKQISEQKRIAEEVAVQSAIIVAEEVEKIIEGSKSDEESISVAKAVSEKVATDVSKEIVEDVTKEVMDQVIPDEEVEEPIASTTSPVAGVSHQKPAPLIFPPVVPPPVVPSLVVPPPVVPPPVVPPPVILPHVIPPPVIPLPVVPPPVIPPPVIPPPAVPPPLAPPLGVPPTGVTHPVTPQSSTPQLTTQKPQVVSKPSIAVAEVPPMSQAVPKTSGVSTSANGQGLPKVRPQDENATSGNVSSAEPPINHQDDDGNFQFASAAKKNEIQQVIQAVVDTPLPTEVQKEIVKDSIEKVADKNFAPDKETIVSTVIAREAALGIYALEKTKKQDEKSQKLMAKHMTNEIADEVLVKLGPDKINLPNHEMEQEILALSKASAKVFREKEELKSAQKPNEASYEKTLATAAGATQSANVYSSKLVDVNEGSPLKSEATSEVEQETSDIPKLLPDKVKKIKSSESPTNLLEMPIIKTANYDKNASSNVKSNNKRVHGSPDRSSVNEIVHDNKKHEGAKSNQEADKINDISKDKAGKNIENLGEDIISQERDLQNPENDVKSSEKDIQSSEKDIQSPERDVQGSENDIESQEKENESMEKGTESLGKDIGNSGNKMQVPEKDKLENGENSHQTSNLYQPLPNGASHRQPSANAKHDLITETKILRKNKIPLKTQSKNNVKLIMPSLTENNRAPLSGQNDQDIAESRQEHKTMLKKGEENEDAEELAFINTENDAEPSDLEAKTHDTVPNTPITEKKASLNGETSSKESLITEKENGFPETKSKTVRPNYIEKENLIGNKLAKSETGNQEEEYSQAAGETDLGETEILNEGAKNDMKSLVDIENQLGLENDMITPQLLGAGRSLIKPKSMIVGNVVKKVEAKPEDLDSFSNSKLTDKSKENGFTDNDKNADAHKQKSAQADNNDNFPVLNQENSGDRNYDTISTLGELENIGSKIQTADKTEFIEPIIPYPEETDSPATEESVNNNNNNMAKNIHSTEIDLVPVSKISKYAKLKPSLDNSLESAQEEVTTSEADNLNFVVKRNEHVKKIKGFSLKTRNPPRKPKTVLRSHKEWSSHRANGKALTFSKPLLKVEKENLATSTTQPKDEKHIGNPLPHSWLAGKKGTMSIQSEMDLMSQTYLGHKE